MRHTFSAVLAAAAVIAGLGASSPSAAMAAPKPQVKAARTVSVEQAKAAGLRFFDLPARDGTILKANVIEPKGAGPHPAIVFIAAFAANDFQYLAQAVKYAAKGYVVLSYTPRGLFGSGGEVDFIGPKDVSDVSAAIDWLGKNSSADINRVGAAGISYGGDMLYVAPAFDKRIKAVAAMSAYTDLPYSVYRNQTRTAFLTELLDLGGRVLGRPSAESKQAFENFRTFKDIDKTIAWAAKRSGINYVEKINQHQDRPAILMANAFGDSFFPPNQVVDFYSKYAGPKRMRFAPGDHATVEGSGLAALPNTVWTDVERWFDHYLAGAKNGIDTEKPVVLTPQASTARESYDSWTTATRRVEKYGLGAGSAGTGTLASGTGTGGKTTINAGNDTPAGTGVPFVSNSVTQFTGIPPTANLAKVSRKDAGVWVSPPLTAARKIRGIPELKLDVTSSAATNTFIAHLYDVDALGTGKLVSYAPYTLRGVQPGTPTTVDLKLNVAAYDVPVGHRLAVVIDTKDLRYIEAGQKGSTLTFGPQSALGLPVH